ncbi:HAD-IA family hydrolase [Rhizobium aegyptiacum]|uniref:HAD-IA family hydrolase n=1 Tax=Rhizobium aegyptiacum TaxID=1764550 RepID=UPI0007E55E81|nr:HAD-IA family hydrolase [Rhizobium aegyptiacum]
MSNVRNGIDWPDAVLFDLDGTLIDSAPDIAAAVNELLAIKQLAPLSVDAVREMIGNGVPKLVERAFVASGCALTAIELDLRVAAMMRVYSRHLTNHTTLMPGALETVSGLAARGVKMAVVSNKPHSFTKQILDHFGFSSHLAAVQGADPCLLPKPAPDMLNAVLDRLGISASRVLFVGDSAVDSDAAKAAAIPVVIVRGGYGGAAHGTIRADAVCSTLFDLLEFIERLPHTGKENSRWL